MAIQGLRAAAMRREEAGGGREGGGESQRRASQRAGASPPGWHRGPERSGARGWKGTSAGACGPGLGGASRPGQGGSVGSHRWFLPKVLPHICREGAGAFWRVTIARAFGTRTSYCLISEIRKGAGSRGSRISRCVSRASWRSSPRWCPGGILRPMLLSSGKLREMGARTWFLRVLGKSSRGQPVVRPGQRRGSS